jgi:hypothetical protein
VRRTLSMSSAPDTFVATLLAIGRRTHTPSSAPRLLF